MSRPQSDLPVSSISAGDSGGSQPSPASADPPGSPAVVGPLGPVGCVIAASYPGVSASAVTFLGPARRPYPDPRPIGSAVLAPPTLHVVLGDSEEDTLMEILGMEVMAHDAYRTGIRMLVDGARRVIGIPHGGATTAFIETAVSMVARASAFDDAVPVGAGLTTSHLYSTSQGWMKAIATLLYRDRRTMVYQATVTSGDEHTIAVGTLHSLFT